MTTHDDDFLSALREDPPPVFAQQLRSRLAAIEGQSAPRRRISLRPLLGLAAGLVVIGALAASPAVRAAASEFLEVFRVRRFAAVPVDQDRLARLQKAELDIKALLSDQIEVIEEPGEATVVADAAAAEAAAGFELRLPTWLPKDASLDEIRVSGAGKARLQIDASRTQEILAALGVPDAKLPPSADGAVATISTSPVIQVRYSRGTREIVLTEAMAPVVALPSELDLTALGELALRAAGMGEEEARLFARRVDWRSTLLVPVPAIGGHFRDVEVRGQRGIVVTHTRAKDPRDRHSLLLWTEGDRIFALAGRGAGADGRGEGVELLEMAESLS